MAENDIVIQTGTPVPEASPVPPEKPGGSQYQIEVVDDTPPEDRGRPPRDPAAPEPDEYASDEELKQYSEGVQSRIKKLKFDYHDQRRRAEAAERERNEAVDYARYVASRAVELKKLLETTGGYATEEAKARVGSQMSEIRTQLAEAWEKGDHAKAAELQEQLAVLAADKQRTESMRVEVPDLQPPPPAVTQQRPMFSDKARAWHEKNSGWWGKDREKTEFAAATHYTIVLSGVPPDSDLYYQRLNATLENFDRARQPQPGTQQQAQQPAEPVPARRETPHVTPVARTPTGGFKVALTKTQVDLARRLGLTLEEYAKEVILKERERNA